MFQSLQLFGVERRQSAQLDTAQVAAAALDPQDFFLLSAQRIDLLDFRTGVSAAKVGDAKIGAQQVRPVAQQFGLVETTGDLLVPTVFQITQTCFDAAWRCSQRKKYCRNAVTVSIIPKRPPAPESRSYHTPPMQ